MTPVEAQLTAQANQMVENNLSSVFICTKTEMKTGKQYTDWEIKVKHQDPIIAAQTANKIDQELRAKYGTK